MPTVRQLEWRGFGIGGLDWDWGLGRDAMHCVSTEPITNIPITGRNTTVTIPERNTDP
jgi:hypothetical protein